MRMFIAVEIEDKLKEEINNIVEKLKSSDCKVKWVEKENLHITLRFLGETKENKLNSVKKSIKEAITGFKKFKLSIAGFGMFPNQKFPRVLWLGIKDGAKELTDISKKLNPSKPEKYFSCHLTIGRFKDTRNLDKLSEALNKLNLEHVGETEISSVTLFQSELTSKGPIYKPLERFTLC